MTGQGTRADDGSAEGVGVKPAPVLIIPGGIEQQDEVLGTKPKFWFWDPSLGRALFKWSDRPGEDWAEWLKTRYVGYEGVARKVAPITWLGVQALISPDRESQPRLTLEARACLLGLQVVIRQEGQRLVVGCAAGGAPLVSKEVCGTEGDKDREDDRSGGA